MDFKANKSTKRTRRSRTGAHSAPPTSNLGRHTPALRVTRISGIAVFGLAIAIVLLLCGMFFGMQRCSADNSQATLASYTCPYDWAGLAHDGDRVSYSENGLPHSRQGIDVSEHQGSIDWQAVANDNIDFAIVSVGNRGYTEGALFVDDRFFENIDGAANAGLDVGAYFFSQAITVEEAREEADFVLEQLGGRALAYPVAFDHEPVTDSAGRANNVDAETLTACARAFCERIEAGGYQAMIYGNRNDLARVEASTLDDYPVWLAEYDVANPTAQLDYVMWQYSSSGQVAGIATYVDMNVLLKLSL